MKPTKEQVLDLLNALLNREYNSLTRAVLKAAPYVDDSMREAKLILRGIAAQEKDAARLLSDLIFSLKGVPAVQSFDTTIGDINYLSLRALLPRILEFKRKQIELFNKTTDICGATRDNVWFQLGKLTYRTQRHIEQLELLLKV